MLATICIFSPPKRRPIRRLGPVGGSRRPLSTAWGPYLLGGEVRGGERAGACLRPLIGRPLMSTLRTSGPRPGALGRLALRESFAGARRGSRRRPSGAPGRAQGPPRIPPPAPFAYWSSRRRGARHSALSRVAFAPCARRPLQTLWIECVAYDRSLSHPRPNDPQSAARRDTPDLLCLLAVFHQATGPGGGFAAAPEHGLGTLLARRRGPRR